MEVGARLGIRPYDIEAAGAGVVVAVWQEPDYRYRTGRISGGKLTGRQVLTKTGERSTEVQVTASSDGSARFVWRPAGVGTPKELHGIDQSSTGKLSDQMIIGPTSHCPAREVFPLAMDGGDGGDSILAWSGSDPSGLDVAFRSSDADTWSKQMGAVPEGSGPACYAEPTVGVAADGSVLVTWQNYHSDAGQMDATALGAPGNDLQVSTLRISSGRARVIRKSAIPVSPPTASPSQHARCRARTGYASELPFPPQPPASSARQANPATNRATAHRGAPMAARFVFGTTLG